MMWKWVWSVFTFEHLIYEVWSIRLIPLLCLGQEELRPVLVWDFYSIEFWFVAHISGHPVGPEMLETGYHSPLNKISEEHISEAEAWKHPGRICFKMVYFRMYLLEHFWNLVFVFVTICSLISIVKPTRCTSVSNLFYFRMTLYMFWAVFPSAC